MDSQRAIPDIRFHHGSKHHGAWSNTQLYLWAALLAAGLLLLLLLKLFPRLDLVFFHDPVAHVVTAGSAAVLGVILALLVLSVARRANDGRVFLIGLGFLSIASIFVIHAVATPSVLMTGGGPATGWSSIVSLSVGSLFFACSGFNLSVLANRWLMRHARLWVLLFGACWIIYAAVFLVVLPSMPDTPVQTTISASTTPHNQTEHMAGSAAVPADTKSPAPQAAVSFADVFRTTLAVVGLGCFSFATWRHFGLYRRLPSSTGLATVGGIALFGEALLTQQLWVTYGISFWLSHAQIFAGFGIISYAMLVAYRNGQTDAGLLESLFLPGTRARIQAEYGQAIDALVDTLERGEQPTPDLRRVLKRQFAMTENQVQVLERAAEAVAKERQQRQELERLNSELHQLEQAKTQFTQLLVHDLKTPLTALIGFIELLRLDTLTDDQHALVQGALRSGKNLSGLIGDILDISRLEEGRLELMQTTVSAHDLFEESAIEVATWLDQEAKTIEIDVEDALPLLCVDVQIIRRVLLNLLSNAIKHTPPRTRIILRAYQCATPAFNEKPNIQQLNDTLDQSFIALEIEDDGPGISPEYLAKIFDKFEQAPGVHGGRQSSTGLGLTFCRLAVEAHGGTIAVESTVGVRTIFRAVLPKVLPAQQPPAVTDRANQQLAGRLQ